MSDLSVCPSFAGIYLLDIAKLGQTPSWEATRKALNRAGRHWLSIPQQDGSQAILAWPRPRDTGWSPVPAPEPLIRQLLLTHDKTRHITSPHVLKLAARGKPTWYVRAHTSAGLERVVEEIEAMGLQYQWDGVNCVRVYGANVTDITAIIGKVAA